MNKYRADVTVIPKDGVLDTQGKAVERTLQSHGYDAVTGVRVGKFIRLEIEAQDESAAGDIARSVADDLLVNNLIESYSFTLETPR
ncbi:MAG: phosphoribosylformylglycinamidine synthase subunit PurS [Synergistaceae bacterium]|jgi:phosphoribosylformylglycinamidine synthase PurS subunit|nr:phosphoribosylformylglycinamidine synthase subunit PurS [Synergistaceae bacterium]